jgi:hypothetical protein
MTSPLQRFTSTVGCLNDRQVERRPTANLRTQSVRKLREANPPTAETRSGSFSVNLSMTDTC